jgi:hypothetical protein
MEEIVMLPLKDKDKGVALSLSSKGAGKRERRQAIGVYLMQIRDIGKS